MVIYLWCTPIRWWCVNHYYMTYFCYSGGNCFVFKKSTSWWQTPVWPADADLWYVTRFLLESIPSSSIVYVWINRPCGSGKNWHLISWVLPCGESTELDQKFEFIPPRKQSLCDKWHYHYAWAKRLSAALVQGSHSCSVKGRVLSGNV